MSTKYIAKFYRYGSEYEEDFKTLQETLDFLRKGEAAERFSANSITFPSGSILNQDDIYAVMWGYEKPVSEPIDYKIYKKMVLWHNRDQRTLYGLRDDEHGRGEVFELLSMHDHKTVISNFKEVE